MRTCLTFLFVFLALTPFFAQESSFYFGANAAFQSSRIFCSTDSDAGGILEYGFTPKAAAGIDLVYSFNPRIAVHSGFIYSLQGQSYKTAENANAQYKTELNYFKIPVLLEWRSNAEKKYAFLLQGGFQLSLLNKAESSRDRVFYYYSPEVRDVNEYYNSTNVDVVLATGLDVRVRSSHLRVLIRADLSLNDIEVTDKKQGLRAPAGNMTLAIPQLSYLIKL